VAVPLDVMVVLLLMAILVVLVVGLVLLEIVGLGVQVLQGKAILVVATTIQQTTAQVVVAERLPLVLTALPLLAVMVVLVLQVQLVVPP
jgi:hypothetical protein